MLVFQEVHRFRIQLFGKAVQNRRVFLVTRLPVQMREPSQGSELKLHADFDIMMA